MYSESLELCSFNDVLLVVICAGGTNVSVVHEQCQVEAGGSLSDGEGGQAGTPGATGDCGICTGLKKYSNFNCLPL